MEEPIPMSLHIETGQELLDILPSPLIRTIWSFVIDQIVIEGSLPFEFAPGCIIDKADPKQIAKIKEEFDNLLERSPFMQYRFYYEHETIIEQTQNGISSHTVPLVESDWRYYVVSTSNNAYIDLHYAASISDIPLDLIALHFTVDGSSKGWRSLTLLNHFQMCVRKPAKLVTQPSLNAIADIFKSWMRFKQTYNDQNTFPEIPRALGMLDQLSMLPAHSEFHVLGLFAIIEMLITHNPKLEDRGDSITHQMKSKIPLLSRRFDEPIDYSFFFSGVSVEKIWSAMYKYRSAVAHGGIPDFQGDLQVLKNSDHANNFLKSVVKAIIRHSIKEPYLYKDLRGC